jgi:hypothetical protein
LWNSDALPSGSEPSSSSCIESALSFAVRVAVTPRSGRTSSSPDVTGRRPRCRRRDRAIEIDRRLRVDQAVHRVVVGYPVCGAGDLLELLRPIFLRPVDSDRDCARLAAERDDLGPPTPDVDW